MRECKLTKKHKRSEKASFLIADDDVKPEVEENTTKKGIAIKTEPRKKKRFEKPTDEQLHETLLNYQKKMVEKTSKGKNLGNHEPGSWVSIIKRVKDTKLDSVKVGPYQVKAQDPDKPANYTLLFLGLPGTEITVHANDIHIKF